MIRAFLSVELSDDVRARLAGLQQDLKQRIAPDLPKPVRLSWVRPDSLHLTVKFLGDIPDSIVEPLRVAMADVLGTHRPLAIPLERLGGFPHFGQPRVLWVGPADAWERGKEAPRLAALHRAIETCCQTQDLAPDDRPLTAHLTIARIKEGGKQVGQALAGSGMMDRPLSLGSLAVDSIALMRSELRPTGSVYTRLWAVPLGAG